jgi:hypothetical protein
MRISPVATAALIVAFIAFVIAVTTGGEILPYLAWVALATVLVALATFFQFGRVPPEVRRIPVEDFSLWADIGEPGAELKRLGPDQIEPAFRIARADLGSLASNAGLLSQRLSMLIGKHGFDELTRTKLHRNAYSLMEDLRSIVKKMGARENWSAEGVERLLGEIENCAARTDRIANKLFDLQREKPEIVRTYLEPLRRATEKLSRDLRLMSTNLNNYIKESVAAPSSAAS